MVNWFAVHVLSGRETKTKDLLLHRSVNAKLWGDTIIDILTPTEKEYVTRNGKRKAIDKKIFPGYIFIKMQLEKESEALVASTDGVAGFVKSGNKPAPLSDIEVANMLKCMVDSEDSTPRAKFKNNDIILVVSGPFSDFTGKIESVDVEKGVIKAYIQIFGRETLVELPESDVKLND